MSSFQNIPQASETLRRTRSYYVTRFMLNSMNIVLKQIDINSAVQSMTLLRISETIAQLDCFSDAVVEDFKLAYAIHPSTIASNAFSKLIMAKFEAMIFLNQQRVSILDYVDRVLKSTTKNTNNVSSFLNHKI